MAEIDRPLGAEGGVGVGGPKSIYSDGRSLPTHDGLCPAPLLSEMSVGVGFMFRYQMLAAPAPIDSGFAISAAISDSVNFVAYICKPHNTPFHTSFPGFQGASPHVNASKGGFVLP